MANIDLNSYLKAQLQRRKHEFKNGRLPKEHFLLQIMRKNNYRGQKSPILNMRDVEVDMDDFLHKGYFTREWLEEFNRREQEVRWVVYKDILISLNKRGIKTNRQKLQKFRLIVFFLTMILAVGFLIYTYAL